MLLFLTFFIKNDISNSCVVNVVLILEKTENNRKEAGDGPFENKIWLLNIP